VLYSNSGSNFALEGEAEWRIWSAPRRFYARLRLLLGARADSGGDLIRAFRHVRAAARAGFVEAQFRLGGYYERGRGIACSPGDAAEWYRRAAVKGHPGAQFSLSLMYLHGHGVRRTSAWYRAARRLNEGVAVRNCQALFPHGIEISRDYTEALRWSLAAAHNGRLEAQANAGLLLLQGLGCEADYAEALRWLSMAADQGNAEAQYGMGMLLDRGLGVERDPEAACRWYEAAAAQDHTAAQAALGYLYGFGEAGNRDPERAKQLLGQASDRGNSAAPYYLGMLLFEDDRNRGDLLEVEACFLRAAQRAYVPAMVALANFYLRGELGNAATDRAEIWLRAAAEAGDAEAQFQLGALYADRSGEPGATTAALRYYRQAADQGHASAQHNCAEMLLAGGHPRAAALWFAAAAAQGIAESQLMLGDLYASGRGVPRSLQLARDWYEKAASNGLRRATPKLARSTRLLLPARSHPGGADAVQLAVWNLDDLSLNRAFGNVSGYVETLAALAKRGIVSLIGANASLTRVQPHLVQHGLWEDCVFPLPGREVALREIVAIAEAAIIPTGSVLLIDDDPKNQAEGARRGLQVAASSIASQLLADPRIAGNDDATLLPAVRSVLIEETSVTHEVDGPWYRAAAQAGDAEAQSILAWALLTGDGCEADAVSSFSWFKRSAEAGFVPAQLQLSIMYRDGVGVPVDQNLASKWLTRAADAGNDEARELLEAASRDSGTGAEGAQGTGTEGASGPDAEGTPDTPDPGAEDAPGPDRDAEAAAGSDIEGASGPGAEAAPDPGAEGDPTVGEFPWYRISAEAGDPEAQSILAWACLTGDNCEQDEVMAAFWFEKSARAGFVPSQLQLGSMYYDGVGVPQCADEAAAWFRLAAEAGDGEAQFRIACMLWEGEGVASDRAAARDWYRKAAQSGNADAQAFIDHSRVESSATGQSQGDTAQVAPSSREGHGESAQVAPSSRSVAGSPAETEAVRLVIWDLDDTFWRGTLAEGGIDGYLQENHDLVVALAARGIMSSICSRNDYAAVRGVLEERGLWQYFIFPSIDWTPKGRRVAAIVESAQLRPPTVLFLDDNPLNRAAVAAAVPGIQTAGPALLAGMLDDRLFHGKDDRKLSRLAQYKLLEQRQVERQATEGGDEEFLRRADIRVIIDTDIAGNIDRAIELINRTNQLNFTKRRLPESPEPARAQLRKELSPFYSHAGLVRVIDNYGDYGFCGYYRLEGDTLVDYCFSCRILGMGVESWLYERLGRPWLAAVGGVLTDLTQPCRVDWIRLSTNDGAAVAVAERVIPEVRLRGGCELDALAHYFRLVAEHVRSETNRSRPPLFVRMDATVQLLPALDGMAPSFRDAASRLGFAADDFESRFLAPVAAGSILVYSPWADIYQAVYWHKTEGFRIPVNVHIHSDLTRMSDEDLAAAFEDLKLDEAQRSKIISIVETLRSEFRYEFHTPLRIALDIIRRVFERIPAGARLYFILPHEWYKEGDRLLPRAVKYNQAVRQLAARYSAVTLVSMNDVVHGEGEMQDSFDHFDRVVYFRLYQRIMEAIGVGQVFSRPVVAP